MLPVLDLDGADADPDAFRASLRAAAHDYGFFYLCLLYTSDAADE